MTQCFVSSACILYGFAELFLFNL
uniref:Uncharacterized protein n=1 Tax=Anguilla anguilla TaxID=7936 RepID=A0A0E9RP55_ANGAN